MTRRIDSGESAAPARPPPRPWHAIDAAEALAALDSDHAGLTEAEASRRIVEFGANRLPDAPREGILRRAARQVHNLLIYVLLASAAVSLLLGHPTDAAVILGVVVINAVVGLIQEGRAEQALDAIRGMIDPRATVYRDGHRQTVQADRIVPGDIVMIEAGDRVPADLRLIRARSLRIDEAVLTGESVPVDKTVDPVGEAVPPAERHSIAFCGTFVAAGQGIAVVVGTGTDTELGRISALIGGVEMLKTPLIRQMDGFSGQLTIAILGVSLLAFLFAIGLRGYEPVDAFMVMVGLAVAAIPEGLPAIMTIALAIGVKRMAARNAIIRRLPAVETLGSVSVICSDKTGTLTRNEMTVRALLTEERTLKVGGAGYAPDGTFLEDGREVEPEEDAVLQELLRAAALCNDAELARGEHGWRVDGDPMEGALVALAMKGGIDAIALRKSLPRTDEIPFDASHRFMATLHHGHEAGPEGAPFFVIKGAPERIFDMCGSVMTASAERPIDRPRWHERAEALAASGYRVLAFATKPAAQGTTSLTFADVESGAVLLGLAGFIDPPRDEAVAAVDDCRAAGIRVVMITGDHVTTAREIARQLHLSDDPKALTGTALDRMDEAEFREAVRRTDVFARTTPEHKLRLVEALQADGLTVAMTGDGVNDAPALKRADVGVAMGGKGTEAAKEAAEMVLADDNFASIVAAVREGRTVYDNLMKVIAWTLPTNGGEALTILIAIAFGLSLPVTPVQILWINMVTAVALGLTLAWEPTEPGTMRRLPRDPSGAILSGDLLWRIGFVSVVFVAGAFGIFYWAEARGLPIEVGRTMVVNTIVSMEIFYLFAVRYIRGPSLTWIGLLGTPAVLIGVAVTASAQLAFTYLPPLQRLFDSRPLDPLDLAAIVGVGVALLLAVEAEKKLRGTFGAAR